MKMLKTAAALLAVCAASVAQAGYENKITLGLGYGELADGGASDFATHSYLQYQGEFDFGLVGGLRYMQADFKDLDTEFNFANIKLGYQFGVSDSVSLAAGVQFEQLELASATSDEDENTYGAWLGLGYAITEGLNLSLELGYLDEYEAYEYESTFEFVYLGAGYGAKRACGCWPVLLAT